MKFLFSSLGKKIQVAFSGLLLCIFLLMHLINNMALFVGPNVFNTMVETLESIKPIIRIMEFGLLGILLLHIVNALQLTWYNKKVSPKQFAQVDASTSTLNSRTMAISGSVILLFLIIHLRYLWYTYQAHLFISIDETYYDVILRNELGYLGHTPTSIFYILSIILIGSHLKHGFQSALKTFGILRKSRWGILYNIAILFWAIIPALFILIIVSIQIGWIN
tara:strand:- start:107 stop:769 length:663 start_codon:yes stop_codon:yes gene_type:complete